LTTISEVLIGIFLFAIISLFFDKKWNWGGKILEMGVETGRQHKKVQRLKKSTQRKGIFEKSVWET